MEQGEDPYPGPFIEEVPFYGGGYAVFPGLTSGANGLPLIPVVGVFQGR